MFTVFNRFLSFVSFAGVEMKFQREYNGGISYDIILCLTKFAREIPPVFSFLLVANEIKHYKTPFRITKFQHFRITILFFALQKGRWSP